MTELFSNLGDLLILGAGLYFGGICVVTVIICAILCITYLATKE